MLDGVWRKVSAEENLSLDGARAAIQASRFGPRRGEKKESQSTCRSGPAEKPHPSPGDSSARLKRPLCQPNNEALRRRSLHAAGESIHTQWLTRPYAGRRRKTDCHRSGPREGWGGIASFPAPAQRAGFPGPGGGRWELAPSAWRPTACAGALRDLPLPPTPVTPTGLRGGAGGGGARRGWGGSALSGRGSLKGEAPPLAVRSLQLLWTPRLL